MKGVPVHVAPTAASIPTPIVRRREPTAHFEAFFLAEYARAVGIARRIVGDVASAEDVAQDVFAALARTSLDDPSRAGAALHATVVRRALDAVRSRQRRERRELRAATLGDVHVASHAGDPAGALDREETSRIVRAAMARLSKRDAGLLAMRYAGLSYAEIARALRIPERNVGTYLTRAQRAFRTEIGDAARF